ncbi:MAG: hypothetical protein SPL99_06505 [Catonella sp.]|jgi:hypothetical protein|nr:hypothetical protein [Catonella sp.]MDY6356993.1 hypothetical protein [Catonella sp.]
MLDFEKELEKFKPSLEVDDAEDAIKGNDMSDVADLIKEIIEENEK